MPSVLITGSNRGIGLEFAKQYAAAGYRVFATARSHSAELSALARSQSKVSLHQVEVTEAASVKALADALRGEPIDVLLIAIVINPGWVQTDMGGKQAPTRVEDSITMMRKVFDELTSSDAGSFKNYKGGDFPW